MWALSWTTAKKTTCFWKQRAKRMTSYPQEAITSLRGEVPTRSLVAVLANIQNGESNETPAIVLAVTANPHGAALVLSTASLDEQGQRHRHTHTQEKGHKRNTFPKLEFHHPLIQWQRDPMIPHLAVSVTTMSRKSRTIPIALEDRQVRVVAENHQHDPCPCNQEWNPN
jgi:hypothetical protein